MQRRMARVRTEKVFRTLRTLLVCVAAAAGLEERGCILSVQAQEFVSFDPESKHVFLEHTHEPKRFVVAEYKKNGTVQEVVGVPGQNQFFGVAGNALALVSAEEDFLYLHRVPQNLVKMRTQRRCVCTSYSKRHLLLEKCDFYEDDIGQYFAWIESGICNEVSEVLMRLKSQNRLIKKSLLRRLAGEIANRADSDEEGGRERHYRKRRSPRPAQDGEPSERRLPVFLRAGARRGVRRTLIDLGGENPKKHAKRTRRTHRDRNRKKSRETTKDVRAFHAHDGPSAVSESEEKISDDCTDMMETKSEHEPDSGEFSLSSISNRILTEEACNMLRL